MTTPYSSAIVKFMQKRAIYDDDRKYWSILQQHETAIRDTNCGFCAAFVDCF